MFLKISKLNIQAYHGMRNRITHAYFDVDVQLLWETIQNDFPALKVELQKIS